MVAAKEGGGGVGGNGGGGSVCGVTRSSSNDERSCDCAVDGTLGDVIVSSVASNCVCEYDGGGV